MGERPDRPWKEVAGGLAVIVRATPKGGRDSLDGIAMLADGRAVLKARVRAAPTDGEANGALGRLLARAVGIAPSAVSLLQGAAGRIKTFRLNGDPALLAAKLNRTIEEEEARKP